MILSKVLRMGIQKTPYQKVYQLEAGLKEFTFDFKGSNRHFDLLEVLLVYDESDKYLTIYDSYNAECAAEKIKSSMLLIFLSLANILEAYSVTNTKKSDRSNDTHSLWKKFLA